MSRPEPLGEARCREILEVEPGAGLEEVRRAHTFLRALYAPGPGSLDAPGMGMDEFDPAVRARVLEEVEAAWQELSARLEAPAPAPRPAPGPAQDPGRILDGPALRRAREAAGCSLERMAAETSVRLAWLQALEEERFGDLPTAAVIVRGYLTACLAALGLEAGPSVADYVQRFQRWQGKP